MTEDQEAFQARLAAWGSQILEEKTRLEIENAELREKLGVESMRLAACGVVAMSDTRETAAEVRKMHADYWSASCADVARAVDELMAIRDLLASRPEVVQIIFRNDSDRTQMAGSNAWFVEPGYALAIIRTDMNNSRPVKPSECAVECPPNMVCGYCNGTGGKDTPFSESDPGCDNCCGTGMVEDCPYTLPGQDEVLDKLRALKCERKEG